MKIYTVIGIDNDDAEPYGVKSFKDKDEAQKYANRLANKTADEYSNDDPSDINVESDWENNLIDINIDDEGSIGFVFITENELN